MRLKRTLTVVAVVLLLLAGVGYHFIFGFTATQRINASLTLVQQKNLLGQIGANMVVYSDAEHTIVVDTQLGPLASLLKSKMKSLVGGPVNTVVITHWHPDHSGGIAEYSADATVLAHTNVQKRLSEPQEGFGLTKPGSYHQFPALSPEALPNQTIMDSFDLDLGGSRVVHYPHAHTDGDLVVFFGNQDVVVLGDLVWPESFPYIDLHNGGSAAGLQQALGNILQQTDDAYHFIPGHGDMMTYDDLQEYLHMVTKTRAWVKNQTAAGLSLEEMADVGLPDEWKNWSSSLVPESVWIEMIHDSGSLHKP